jgi:hypothetical protein
MRDGSGAEEKNFSERMVVLEKRRGLAGSLLEEIGCRGSIVKELLKLFVFDSKRFMVRSWFMGSWQPI